ncbi:glycosyltransferase [bacterium]|nr:glycosyltransferase [bacterium]
MKVTAILPAFNEEKTIANVLTTLINSDLINEIIVVDDASTDNTLRIVQSFDCKKLQIISLEKNVGKSDAVKIATINLETEILFFCDGDLHNFKEKHIKQILVPFKHETIAMSAGIRDYGKVTYFLSKHIFPLITGERALHYSIFRKVRNNPLMKGYGLEVVLNNYCKMNKIPVYKSILKGLRQTNKPIKRKNGFYLLLKQSIEIIKIMLKLKFRNYKNYVR